MFQTIFEYDVDSADEWEEEGEGESLRGSEDEKEEEEEEGGDQYEVSLSPIFIRNIKKS